MAVLFIVGIATILFIIALMYIIDVTQKTHAIRRNYPVIGRFRYLFERPGGNFFVSTSSPWTGRSCLLTAPSDHGVIGLRRILIIQLLLVQLET